MARDPKNPLTLDDVERVFFALAHEARRHIVALLGHTGGELPSGYLAQRFPHSWPTTTRHLQVLEEAGVVRVRRHGRQSFYKLDRERVQRVVGGWLANLEQPTPDRTWTSSGPKTTQALRQQAQPKRKKETT